MNSLKIRNVQTTTKKVLNFANALRYSYDRHKDVFPRVRRVAAQRSTAALSATVFLQRKVQLVVRLDFVEFQPLKNLADDLNELLLRHRRMFRRYLLQKIFSRHWLARQIPLDEAFNSAIALRTTDAGRTIGC